MRYINVPDDHLPEAIFFSEEVLPPEVLANIHALVILQALSKRITDPDKIKEMIDEAIRNVFKTRRQISLVFLRPFLQ